MKDLPSEGVNGLGKTRKTSGLETEGNHRKSNFIFLSSFSYQQEERRSVCVIFNISKFYTALSWCCPKSHARSEEEISNKFWQSSNNLHVFVSCVQCFSFIFLLKLKIENYVLAIVLFLCNSLFLFFLIKSSVLCCVSEKI